MSKSISAAVAAVVSAESTDLFQGEPVNPSLVETLEQLGREYWSAEDARSVAEKSLAKCDVSLFDHVKGLKYPDFMFVRKLFVTGCRDKGAETDEAASKVWERAIGRIVNSCGFVRPKSESKDAERIAARRAEEAKKFEAKSDGVLLEEKAALLAKGDVKSLKAAQAVAKELDRREKPVTEAIVKDCAALRDKLIARAKEVAKLGTEESVKSLTAALFVMSE
jgi:protein-tyrosine-phosphatase